MSIIGQNSYILLVIRIEKNFYIYKIEGTNPMFQEFEVSHSVMTM